MNSSTKFKILGSQYTPWRKWRKRPIGWKEDDYPTNLPGIQFVVFAWPAEGEKPTFEEVMLRYLEERLEGD